MSSMRLLAVVTGLCTVAAAAGPGRGVAASPGAAPADQHWQTIETYCEGCHNATDWAGSVAFDTMSADDVAKDSKVWETAIKKLRSGLMPPPTEKKQPDHATVQNTINWLEGTLDQAQ